MSAESKRPIEEQLEAWADQRRATTGGPFTIHPATRKMLLDEAHRQHPKAALNQLKTEPTDAVPSPLAKWWRWLAVGTTAVFVTIILAMVYVPGSKNETWQFTKATDQPGPSRSSPKPTEPTGGVAGLPTSPASVPESKIILAGGTLPSETPGGAGDRYTAMAANQSATLMQNAGTSPLEVPTLEALRRKENANDMTLSLRTNGVVMLTAGTESPLVTASRLGEGNRDPGILKQETGVTFADTASQRGGVKPAVPGGGMIQPAPAAVPVESRERATIVVAKSIQRAENASAPTMAGKEGQATAVSVPKSVLFKDIPKATSLKHSSTSVDPRADAMKLSRVGSDAAVDKADLVAGTKAKNSIPPAEKPLETENELGAITPAAVPALLMIPSPSPSPLIETQAPMPASGSLELLPLDKLQVRQQFSQVEGRSQLRRNFNSPATPTVLNTFHVENQGRALRIVDADGSVYTGLLGETPKDRFTATRGASTLGIPFRASGSNRTLDQEIILDGNLSVPAADASAAQLRGRVTIGGRVQMEVNATASPQ